MRIAQVAPLNESVPPKLYGGTERVVSYLTEELTQMGREVTLFASGDSQTKAKLVAACPQALWRSGDCRETLPHHIRLMELVFQDVSRFDVIHFHCDYFNQTIEPLLRDSQSWVEFVGEVGGKDADDAIFHEDGATADGPIALCEVQGYVYAARKAGAMLAKAMGLADRAAGLERQAEGLQERFEQELGKVQILVIRS